MITDKEFNDTIVNCKKSIENEWAMIMKFIANSKSKLDTLIPLNGFIGGSCLLNFYSTGKNFSDIDYFVYDIGLSKPEYLSNTLENFPLDDIIISKKVGKTSEYDEVSTYVGDIKLKIGNLNKRELNVIFCSENPLQHFKTFDFEICNWYYDTNRNTLNISEDAIELIKRKELDYTEGFKKKIRQFKSENGTLSKNTLDSMMGRIKKYSERGYIPTKDMIKFIEEIKQ